MIATFPKQTNLGHILKEARTDAGLLQKECAARCDYTVRQWQYWEHGKRLPTGRALKAIIRLFPNLKSFV
jgi:transcriptional regulator with XRE-family HTH domain